MLCQSQHLSVSPLAELLSLDLLVLLLLAMLMGLCR
jgi:hypothetical protein